MTQSCYIGFRGIRNRVIRCPYCSIAAFIHLPGWPFPLNYGLRLSITLYFWFCNYSPPSDISALQYWIEYVTLGLLCLKVKYSQLGYSVGMFQPLQLIIPRTMKLLGVYCFHSVRPSVRLCCIRCPLCSTYSSGWIHFIFIHLIKQLQGMCRV